MIDPEIDRFRRQNRELVTEIKIRDGLISDLQNRLAALEEENATLRLFYKDWCQGHSYAG
jgi:hypothetical protein